MKEKKFPLIPVSILGVAIIGGGIMVMNKPFVGGQEEWAEMKAAQFKEEQARQAANNVTGASRKGPSEDDLTKQMEGSLKGGERGNAGVRTPPREAPLIVHNVPKKVTKPPVNDATTAQQWWDDGSRFKDADKK
jgi:hypothetical protein